MDEFLEIPQDYQSTPVGIIPDDWEVKPFDKCFEYLRAYTFSRNQLDYNGEENVIYNIHYGDIHSAFPKNLLDVDKNIELIPRIIEPKIDNPVLLEDGDLIMADASEDYEGIGQSVELINVGNRKIVSGTHTFPLRPIKKFAPRFAGYIFSNFNTHKEIKKIATGISVYGISKSNLSKINLPIPPLPEQKAIADCLTTWDKGIEKLSALIQSKKEQKKGLMQQIFNGQLKVENGELIQAKDGEDFTKEWGKMRLGEILEESKIISEENDKSKRISVRLHLEGVHKRPVRGTEADSTTFYKRKSGQFIYGKQNFHNGSLGIIPEEFDGFETTSDLPSFNINNKVNHNWFFYYISRFDFYSKMESKTTGTGSKRLHPRELFSTKIPKPSIEEQTAIAEILQTADKEIELLEKKLEAFKIQKKGLMQVLLTGTKRLVDS